MIVDGQSVKFSKDEIAGLGISGVDYGGKWYVIHAHYTQEVAQNMLPSLKR